MSAGNKTNVVEMETERLHETPLRVTLFHAISDLESLLSDFERTQQTIIGQHVDYLAQVRPDDIGTVVPHVQDAISLNFAMQSPVLRPEEQELIQSGILLSQRLQEKRTRKDDAKNKLLVASAIEFVEELASGGVERATEIEREFSVSENCLGVLKERAGTSDSMVYQFLLSSSCQPHSSQPDDKRRRISVQSRAGVSKTKEDLLTYALSSNTTLVIIVYLSRDQPRLSLPTLRRLTQRLEHELQLHKDAVANYLLLDRQAYLRLIFILDSFLKTGRLSAEAGEAAHLVTAAALAIDDRASLREALADPDLASLNALPWYSQTISSFLEQACVQEANSELRMYVDRLLFVSCKWDQIGLRGFLSEADHRILQRASSISQPNSDTVPAESFSKESCFLFGDSGALLPLSHPTADSPSNSRDQLKALDFPRLVKQVEKIMLPFLLEHPPGVVSDSQDQAGQEGSVPSPGLGAFSEVVSEAIVSYCRSTFESTAEEFSREVSTGGARQGGTSVREENGKSYSSTGERVALEPDSRTQTREQVRRTDDPPASSAARIISAMESLVILAAKQQVITEYYHLNGQSAALSASADAIRETLARLSRLALSLRLGGSSASTVTRPLVEALWDHSGGAFPLEEIHRLAWSIDQVLIWLRFKYLGVFPLEADHLFSGAVSSLAVYLSSEAGTAIRREISKLGSRSSQRKARDSQRTQIPQPRHFEGQPGLPGCAAICSLAQYVYELVDHTISNSLHASTGDLEPDSSESKALQELSISLCYSISEAVISGIIQRGAGGEKLTEMLTQDCIRPALAFVSSLSAKLLPFTTPAIIDFIQQCRYSRSYRATLENLSLGEFVPVLAYCRLAAAEEIYSSKDFPAVYSLCSQFRPHTSFPKLCILDVLSPGELSGLVKNTFEEQFSKRGDVERFYDKVSALKALTPLTRDEISVRRILETVLEKPEG